MNVYQLYIWNYWRCAKKQLNWCCFYLEIFYHRLQNSCSSSNFVLLDYLNYPQRFAFYFSSSIDLLKICPFSWLGSSCLVWDLLPILRCEYFLWDVSLKLCVCIRCKLRREVPFKLIFIGYNIEPLGLLVFFLTLRARGMSRQWRWRRTRRSPPSLLFTWLLTSLLSSSRWRGRLGRRGCATSFPCLSFLEIFGPFWTRILLNNSLLYFWAMRAILLIFLIASFALYILEINLCHSLPPLCKAIKSWKRRMEVWAPLLYCHDTGRIQHLIEMDFMKWNPSLIA